MEAAIITASGAIIAVLLTQFVAEAYRRFRDGSALAAGLAGELSSYKEAFPQLEAAFEVWCKCTGGHELYPLRPMEQPIDQYYAKTVEKIGLLGPGIVEDIVYVYSNLGAFRLSLSMLTKHFKEMSLDEFKGRAANSYASLNRARVRGEVLVPRLVARSHQTFIGAMWKALRTPKF